MFCHSERSETKSFHPLYLYSNRLVLARQCFFIDQDVYFIAC